jgi:hypothetical protein
MIFNLFCAIQYIFYYKYRFSKASTLGPASYDEYIKVLGAENVVCTNDTKFKRIKWEDNCTFYVFVFSLDGQFKFVEREIWYDYKFPKLTKTILLEYNRFKFQCEDEIKI